MTRPWLKPGLSRDERLKRATIWAATQGWQVRDWNRSWSMVQPWRRVIFLADEDSLPHELGHVRRIEEQGRWWWLAKYVGGFVAVGAWLLVSLGTGSWGVAGFGAFLAGWVWAWSEHFREDEEVWAWAEGRAYRMAAGLPVVGMPLGNYQTPYVVGGDPLGHEMLAHERAETILEEEDAAGLGDLVRISPPPT